MIELLLKLIVGDYQMYKAKGFDGTKYLYKKKLKWINNMGEIIAKFMRLVLLSKRANEFSIV